MPDYLFYLAAPWFKPVEREFLDHLESRLTGLRYFSPRRDAGILDPKSENSWRRIFEEDLRGIDRSRFVLACVDDFDPGTVFEWGYAHARAMPIVAWTRMTRGRGLNLMLAQSADGFLLGSPEILTFLSPLLDGVSEQPDWAYAEETRLRIRIGE